MHPSTHPPIHPSTHACTHQPIHPSTHPSGYACIHPSMHCPTMQTSNTHACNGAFSGPANQYLFYSIPVSGKTCLVSLSFRQKWCELSGHLLHTGLLICLCRQLLFGKCLCRHRSASSMAPALEAALRLGVLPGL